MNPKRSPGGLAGLPGRLLAAVFLLALSCPVCPVLAAAGSGDNSQQLQPLVTMRRTMCYGTCPVYSLELYEDGTVIYRGEKFVAVTGTWKVSIDPERVAQLVKTMTEAGFFSWRDSYNRMERTDMPSVTLGVHTETRDKTIIHYRGDSSAPRELRRLESLVDQVAGSDRWVSQGSGDR